MRLIVAGIAVLALSFATWGCGGGCDPEEHVFIHVEAGNDLNTYVEGEKAGPHALDLYFFKVDEPFGFVGNDVTRLRVTEGAPPGGQALGRWPIMPGEVQDIDLNAMGVDRWTHVGLYAAYGQPLNTSEAVKRAIEIDSDCRMVLKLGANGIVSFEDD